MSSNTSLAGQPAPEWEFWIDVGGTFTDCFARRPDGSFARYKLLSTGVMKGAVDASSTRCQIVDMTRAADPDDFWQGYQLRLIRQGQVVTQGIVGRFDRGRGALELTHELQSDPVPGDTYELHGDQEAPLIAIRYLLGLRRLEPIPPSSIRLGTTRGTNALLTRKGAKTAFITTRGFGDALRIGYQNRPRLFDLDIVKPTPLFEEVVEIDERIGAGGEVLRVPLEDEIRRQLEAFARRGVESLAICLLHAFEFPDHERLVQRVAREVGFAEISVSHRVAPLIKLVSRGDTTVVDAYLNPVLRKYVAQLRQALGEESRLRIMTSAGGLVDADHFAGKDSILSGPAGGVVGFSRVAQAAGFPRAIGFDMGGTSTDVSRFDGRFEYEYETEKAGVRIVAPMLKIHTVAAGGGSICRFDGVKLVVGPESAGADPGPACYGRGGPLAVTDLNYYLGRLPENRFPFPLDRHAVQRRLAALIAEIRRNTRRQYTPVALCDGFLRVANENMVRAIRSISIAQGVDPRDYVLVAFGGAAGQHVCAVARELGIRQVLSHPDAGLLSAYGIGAAHVTRHRAAGVYAAYSEQVVQALEATFAGLADEVRREIEAEGIPPHNIDIHRALDLRYQGVDACLTISEPSQQTYAQAFDAEHRRMYGYVYPDRPLEIVALRVEAVGRVSDGVVPSRRLPQRREARAVRTSPAWFDGGQLPTAIWDREELRPGDWLRGPAIVCESTSTTVVDPGWSAEVLSGGELLLTHENEAPRQPLASTQADPVMLEIFNNHFAGIAEQMGITLRNTATSVNVKERLDFSCALFNARGELVVNAPHIPVHLGAMGITVRSILAENQVIQPGDVFVTNDPYHGGSHLPDLTVVTPVHDQASGRLLFFTASRAHHAEIGGIVPGSMPPFSTHLAQEGVLIHNLRVVAAGQSRMDELERLLRTSAYPSRAVADNLADVSAQIAANRQGAADLLRLVERYSLPVVEAYMEHIQAAAEQKMRQALSRLPEGRHEFIDYLDEGYPIAVSIRIEQDGPDRPGPFAIIDFTGTGPVVPGNLNANPAIVGAAVLYVMRLLIAEEIPLNEGVLAPIRVILPQCLLNPPPGPDPEHSPAVVGGNVETSQRVVDALLGALNLAAASQGTMNNLIFGNPRFGYYETICGGAGATANRLGADAVHTHMTNTRLTDPEILERRAPVRLLEFSIRRGSGGAGRHRGGDGVVRKIEFLDELDVSILSQRRGPYPPYGLAGGQPGALGRNWLSRPDGSEEELPNQVQFLAHEGDILTIETPGGGGWGTLD
jgi:5-oxoprolinase (ATP-hydrolysing)